MRAPDDEPEPMTISELDTPEMSAVFAKEKSNKDNGKDFALFYSDIFMPVIDDNEPHKVPLRFGTSLADVEEMLTYLTILCKRQGRYAEAERYDHWTRQVRQKKREGR